MPKRNIYDAVAVFNVENHRVAAHLPPAVDDAHALFAAGHGSGQVDGAHFKVAFHFDWSFQNGTRQHPGDNNLLSRMQKVAPQTVVSLAHSRFQLGHSHERSLRQVSARYGGETFPAL